MTNREDMRAKAIDIMGNAMLGNTDNSDLEDREYFRHDAAIALEALGAAGFAVNAPGYIEEQLQAGRRYYSEPLTAYDAIVHAGNLTRKPE